MCASHLTAVSKTAPLPATTLDTSDDCTEVVDDSLALVSSPEASRETSDVVVVVATNSQQHDETALPGTVVGASTSPLETEQLTAVSLVVDCATTISTTTALSVQFDSSSPSSVKHEQPHSDQPFNEWCMFHCYFFVIM